MTKSIEKFLQEKLVSLNNEYNFHLDNNNIDKALSVLDQIDIISKIENDEI